MRLKAIIGLLLVTTSTHAGNAKWDSGTYNNIEGAYASIASQRYTNVLFQVMFAPDNSCNPIAVYKVVDEDGGLNFDHDVTDVGIKMRVDKHPTWTAVGTASYLPVRGAEIQISYFKMEPGFLKELYFGSMLRIQSNDNKYDRFTLNGSAKALGIAFKQCKRMAVERPDPDAEFFNANEIDPDATYF